MVTVLGRQSKHVDKLSTRQTTARIQKDHKMEAIPRRIPRFVYWRCERNGWKRWWFFYRYVCTVLPEFCFVGTAALSELLAFESKCVSYSDLPGQFPFTCCDIWATVCYLHYSKVTLSDACVPTCKFSHKLQHDNICVLFSGHSRNVFLTAKKW